MDISAAGYSSFELSKTLYELSGWPGDIEWADWLPIGNHNHPAYTCGYLIRQLAGVVTGVVVRILIASPVHYEIAYIEVAAPSVSEISLPATKSPSIRTKIVVTMRGGSVEDALVLFCIELWECNTFLAQKPGR